MPPIPPASPSASSCAVCAASLPDGASFCPRCGSATPIEFTKDGQTIGPGAAPPSAAEDAAHRRRLQDALGPTCELRDLLGRGGFAEVYVAYDKRLKRELAVKTLRPDLVVSDTLLQRFQREAEAVAKLRHPNVIPIYTVGEGEGVAYFVMPRIEGESLAAVLERGGKLPVDEAARILREAAGALGAAHRHGIVHRDVKPENIMLEGPDRRTLVMDFGIAKTAEPNAERGLTGTGTLVGTPQYMSPEQATGERDLDHRSDQYSLAMVGFRMLTGKPAFDADSIQTLIFKLVTQPAARASEVEPSVPEPLADVLARALAKRPDDRFPSMEAFAAAVAAATAPAAPTLAILGPQPRREEPLAQRVVQLRAALPSWRSPIVLAAPAALVVLVMLLWRDPPRPAIELAANRSEALFAARSFLAARGVPNAGKVAQTFETDASSYGFLQRTLGLETAERRARTELPVWAWHVALRDPARDQRWVVHVGPDNRITTFVAPPADSTRADSLDSPAARALALRELATLGWSPESLSLISDSTVRHGARTDHVLRWRRAGVALPWRGADTATAQLVTTVAGSRLTSYRQRLDVPASYTREFASGSTGVVTRLVALLILALALYAIALAIGRQRSDTLQWSMAQRTTLALTLVLAPQLVLVLVRTLSRGGAGESTAVRDGAVFGEMLGNGIALALGMGCFMMALAVAESLTHQHRPQTYAGLRELSRGRPFVPEVVTAAAWGIPAGVIFATLPLLGQWAEARLGWDVYETGVSSVFDYSFPVIRLLMMWALGAAAGTVLLYLVALPRQWRLPLAAAVALPGLLALGAVGENRASILTALALGAGFALVAWTGWRQGVLAAAVALAVGFMLPVAIHLLRSGSGEFVSSGVIGLALAAAPAVLAIVAYRKLAR